MLEMVVGALIMLIGIIFGFAFAVAIASTRSGVED